MDVVLGALQHLTAWLAPYYNEISLTVVATLLVIYGDVLNKQIKQLLKPYPFIVRTLVFVFICAFGYGLLIVFLTPFVKQAIYFVPSVYRGISIILTFCLLGYLAENRRYI